MTESKISDFKMFKAPYELPDPNALIGAIMIGIKEQEKVLGPVFSTRVIKYALQFEAQKIGGEPPDNIKTLDQLTEYLISKTDKYPTPNCALMYAMYKTENDLQGQIGAATRVAEVGFHRRFGKKPNSEKRKINLDTAMSNLFSIVVEAKFSPKEFGYKTNEDESVDFILPNCFHKDGCQQAFNENLLKRPDGRIQCILISFLCQYLKPFTGYEWDYDCLEFNAPHCILRCYMF